MDFLFDETMIQNFEGDSEKFIQSVVNIFRVYKKINKTQNLQLWNFIKNLLMESFNSVEVRNTNLILLFFFPLSSD